MSGQCVRMESKNVSFNTQLGKSSDKCVNRFNGDNDFDDNSMQSVSHEMQTPVFASVSYDPLIHTIVSLVVHQLYSASAVDISRVVAIDRQTLGSDSQPQSR